jgi:predicted anti-sigma-YlaC factor YlaD
MTETKSQYCKSGWDLLAKYLWGKQEKHSIFNSAFAAHVATCPYCRARYDEVTAQAAQAVHPELEEE